MLTSEILIKILQRELFSDGFNKHELPNWSFSTNSKTQSQNNWFIALKGQNFDGHDFCKEALNNGAKGLIVSDKKLFDQYNNSLPVILVQDTLKAYQEIAQYHGKILNPIVIAITGSNGKTTTKEILIKVLETKYKVLATEGNENNEIGVPKTILKLDESHEVLILEFGMRGLNQIEELALIAEPNYACITNIGTAHIGILGSREKIAQAKSEIFNSHSPEKIFIPFDEPLLKPEINKSNIQYFGNYKNAHYENSLMKFEYKLKDKLTKFQIQSFNQVLISNACLVIDLASELKVELKNIQKGLMNFSAIDGRGKIHYLSNGALIIDETYNANPDSIRALAKSIHFIANQDKENKKHSILVLGEIAELGDLREALLENLILEISELIDKIIVIDMKLNWNNQALKNNHLQSKLIRCDSIEKAYDFLKTKKELFLQENSIIGIKGSRVAKLEKLLELLLNEEIYY